MFTRIRKYHRFKDYVSFRNFEVYLSFILVVVFYLLTVKYLDIYINFSHFEVTINTILQIVLSGAFGLLGMSLAGMAIITGLFTSEQLSILKKVDKNDTINRVLSQFEFSAFNLVIEIVYILFLQICLSSPKELVNKPVFLSVFAVISYHTFFNVFYILALIGNCIEINAIKDNCEVVSKLEKSMMDTANEIRIDYILAIILKERGVKRDVFLNEILQMVDKSNLKEGEDLKKYLYSYYNN